MQFLGLNISWNRIPHWLIGAGLFGLLMLVAVQMYRGEALICANGDIFPKGKCGTYPQGAIAAFDRDDLDEKKCPKGWKPFLESRGRVIVGAGNPDGAPGKLGFGEDKEPLTNRAFRKHGGSERHKLGPHELPPHRHFVIGPDKPNKSITEWGFDNHGNNHDLRILAEDGNPHHGKTGKLIAKPKDEEASSHNNMPPYIALWYCKKQ